jgi:hypothetical protein
MCTVLLPPGVNPVAVNKYIIYHTRSEKCLQNIGKEIRETAIICRHRHNWRNKGTQRNEVVRCGVDSSGSGQRSERAVVSVVGKLTVTSVQEMLSLSRRHLAF